MVGLICPVNSIIIRSTIRQQSLLEKVGKFQDLLHIHIILSIMMEHGSFKSRQNSKIEKGLVILRVR